MSKPLRILVADDNPDDRLAVSRALRREFPDLDIRVVERDAWPEGTLGGASFDLVITDYHLGWTDGLQILRAVKERHPDVPVIMHTGTGSEEVAVEALRSGLDDYILKDARRISRLPQAARLALERARERRDALEAEARYRDLFENLPIGLYRTTPDGRILDVNAALTRMLGFRDRGDLLAGDVRSCWVDPDARAEWRERMERDGHVRGFRFQARRRDGSVLWVEDHARAVRGAGGKVLCYEGSMQDITDGVGSEQAVRKRAVQQAVVAELGLRALSGVPAGPLMDEAVRSVARALDVEYAKVLELQPDGSLLLRSGVGWKEGLVGRERVPSGPESQAGYTLSVNEPVIVRDLAAETRFSGPKLLHDHGVVSGMSVVIHGRGRPFGVLGAHSAGRRAFTSDDGHFLQAAANVLAAALEAQAGREALRASEERYRLLFESNPHPMWVYDSETLRFLAVNDAAVQQYGYSREEFLSMSIEEIRPSEEVAALRAALAGLAGLSRYERTWKHRKRDGRVISVQISSHAIDFAGRRGRLVLAMDVTEKLRAEEDLQTSLDQLRQSQKMEAIGRLAGGVAHDFNNLLTVINGHADLILESLPEESHQREGIEEIKKAGERAAALTRQLLAYSRRQVLQPRVLDLNAVVADMQSMLRRLIGEDVELKTSLAGDLGRVRADPGQVEQVILNIAVNARDAMPEGGTFTIETANAVLGAADGGPAFAVEPGRYVLLRLADSGVGMDEATRTRIFEPFFTTKPQGKGTGLGLSTVYGIVKQSGGYIWASSRLGEGAAFSIYLPRVDEAPAQAGRRRSEAPAAHGWETVLLVEDETIVRRLIREVLGRLGYQVLEAGSGEEALKISVEHAGTIDLLVTDIVMPQMNGRELATKLKTSRAGTKILFISGYTDEAIGRHGILDPGTHFLQKPFAPEALAAKVREVLDLPAS